ncbi:MAG: orotidine 5'-phosphate decarboxylase [Coriobacteriales bacterium]|jgi:orotidine-5'-phosphate decarboxylase|nr:orotidine 5'-phosphate decarboxylase [Coriobacteriales bacterium]
MDPAESIIVALDTTAEQARRLAELMAGRARWLKVGMTLYYREGPALVREFKDRGYRVFVDLKLHDIPHQVRGAARAVAYAGADLLTVHASGGRAMMEAAREGAEEGYAELCAEYDREQNRVKGSAVAGGGEQDTVLNAGQSTRLSPAKGHPHQAVPGKGRPLCLAITVLTSLDRAGLASTGVETELSAQVLRLAALAEDAGLDGVVCSPEEAKAVRAARREGFILVTPGVRPAGSAAADQRRVATPARARAAGADYLVIGRPITQAADPLAAFEAIAEELKP